MGDVRLNSSGGGSVTLTPPSTASNYTVTLPAATSTLIDTTSTQTLTNKTLTAAGSNSVEATSGPTSSQLAGNRNKIINGAMMIDQRNAGASVTAGSGYTLDRWNVDRVWAGSTVTIQQSSTAPAGFSNSLVATVSTGAASASGNYFSIQQFIEGYNIADMAFGTASAQSFTISFWVRSSVTGAFGVALRNSAFNLGYATTYTINTANTWEYKTLTISGPTSGTWYTNNSYGINLIFSLGGGSSTKPSSNSTWVAGNILAAIGETDLITTTGATFYITGVQLEKGATATPFENRLITTELQLCQRYYCKSGPYDLAIPAPGTAYGNLFFVAGTFNAYAVNTGYTPPVYFPVNMRTTPTLVTVPTSLGTGATSNGQITVYNPGGPNWVTTATASVQSLTATEFNLTCSGVWTAAATLSYYGWTAAAEL